MSRGKSSTCSRCFVGKPGKSGQQTGTRNLLMSGFLFVVGPRSFRGHCELSPDKAHASRVDLRNGRSFISSLGCAW